jgi:hypothetical protein
MPFFLAKMILIFKITSLHINIQLFKYHNVKFKFTFQVFMLKYNDSVMKQPISSKLDFGNFLCSVYKIEFLLKNKAYFQAEFVTLKHLFFLLANIARRILTPDQLLGEPMKNMHSKIRAFITGKFYRHRSAPSAAIFYIEI